MRTPRKIKKWPPAARQSLLIASAITSITNSRIVV
jgi:hypothetical protein